MWRRYLEEAIEGHTADRVVVHTSPDGIDDGYAQYSVAWKDSDGLMETGAGEVAEVRAATAEDWAKTEPSWADQDGIAAWELDACIGHVAAYRFEMLVPGGAWVPTAGVTRVGVLPTHRRRGAGHVGGHQKKLPLNVRGRCANTASARRTAASSFASARPAEVRSAQLVEPR